MVKTIDCYVLSLLLTMTANFAASAQSPLNPSQQKTQSCSDVIYQAQEVMTRAKILSIARPAYPPEMSANLIEGQVKLAVVLCKTGKVTDIRVLESNLPVEVVEQCIQAAAAMQFQPAMKNGQAVSQSYRIKFTFEIQSDALPQPSHSTE
jgi:TonB family protein